MKQQRGSRTGAPITLLYTPIPLEGIKIKNGNPDKMYEVTQVLLLISYYSLLK